MEMAQQAVAHSAGRGQQRREHDIQGTARAGRDVERKKVEENSSSCTVS